MRVGQNENKLNELMQLAKDYPKAFGLMISQGPMVAFLQGLETGVQSPWGSFSAPVYEIQKKLKLTPKEQQIDRQAGQLMADLNQQVMKEGKSIFGPSISNSDVINMLKPGFKESDAPDFIKYLALKHKVTNNFMGRINVAMSEYREKNPDASAYNFFNDKNSPYARLVGEHDATYAALVKKYSPYK